ncbi:MAG TPA: hypothetical protein VMV22_09570 [Acidimicrobiales bacterium]|nr:hypothetical protein [Acidimicrobiales bacterium]
MTRPVVPGRAISARPPRSGVKGEDRNVDNQLVPTPNPARRAGLARVPVARTSLLVAGVTTLALVLVTLTVLGPAPAPAASPSRPPSTSPSTRSPGAEPVAVGFFHPQVRTPPTTTSTTTTAPPPRSPSLPVTTSAPAPKPGPAPPPAPPVAAARPILPPANPAADIAASPAFAGVCVQDGSDSAPCIAAAAQAMASARAGEGLGPMSLPSNYAGLSPGEQLFVLADIERVDRGLPPIVGMVQALDQDAQAAAATNADPTPAAVPPGSGILRWVSNWAEAAGPLGSTYMWMYEDGPGSGNLACSSGSTRWCWGHRDNILGFTTAQVSSSGGVLVMGAAEATVAGDSPWSSDAELIALVTGSPAYTYTWAAAQAAGAR